MSTVLLRKVGVCLASFVSISISTGMYYKHYQMQQKTNEKIFISDYASRQKTQINASDYLEPTSEAEISEIMHKLHQNPQLKCRPTGSHISLNGFSFEPKGMISLENMKSILEIDTINKTITVESGITIQEIFDALSQKGFSLPTATSVNIQQIGGWTQAGCHGTGVTIPPVDQLIEKLKIYSPTYPNGLILSKNDSDPKKLEMFYAATCGLGSLGVVSQITLKIVEKQTFKERIFLQTIDEIEKNHEKMLKSNKMVKYLWIPYTNYVKVQLVHPNNQDQISLNSLKYGGKELKLVNGQHLPFNMRKFLEEGGILDINNIIKTNKAEVESMKNIYTEKNGYVEDFFVFDCSTIVPFYAMEVAFKKEGSNDIQFIKELYEYFKKFNYPAQSSIEQRWTASRRSIMSPAYSENPDDVFCWVSLIFMQLHRHNPEEYKKGVDKFHEFNEQIKPLLEKYNAFGHWGKIHSDIHSDLWRKLMNKRFPKLENFKNIRKHMDPYHQFTNHMIEAIFD